MNWMCLRISDLSTAMVFYIRKSLKLLGGSFVSRHSMIFDIWFHNHDPQLGIIIMIVTI